MDSRNTHHDSHAGKSGGYGRFFAMIGTSTVVMYGLMYLNTYALDHVFFSQTRMWMALYMGGMMAIIMLAFMLGMYSNRKTNIAIFAGAVIAFAAGVYLVRSQDTVGDVAWMRAMIPHHSIAILTSERANISDPRVRELADAIIEAQRGEIAELQRYIADIEANGNAAPRIRAAAPVRLSTGSHLVREWNGRSYQVEVAGDGFRMDGRSWPSLSAIAKHITGTT
ncbi:protein of unknown function [Jannaschia faecimaris]|uniref:Uncharacterized protein n=1 Tax=Jannaschia faecimaris TaxID=1244108 RepID=A0A1H3TS53_9RHOB|nr:DUF2924 domain-containing protein [Jannaschia faecimaris]SDZ52641.1 protein of unknown function [Jannaschia faecimaris]